MPKVFTQYMKNVVKSTGYAINDIAKSMAPNFFEMKEDAKSVANDLYKQIKEFGGPSDGKSAIGKAKDTVNDVFKNMLEDISTGKFYNKERSDALMTDVAKSMGMDFDFDMDFGDDWGSGEDFNFEDTSDENIIKADRRNTRDTIVAIDTVGARLSNEIGQATVASAKMVATANLNATRALYSLNQKGFNQVTEGIIGLNNSITSLGAFMAPLSEHFQNSTKFFAETTKTLYDINNNLTAILKNTTPSPEATNNKYKQNKNTLSSLMSGDTFSISAYKDMVVSNAKEAMGMYSMLGEFFGPLLKSGKGGKNFSPTGMLYTAALKKLIPSAFESAVKSLDENLGHYIAGAIAKAGAKNKNNYGLSGILASIFLPKSEYRETLSTGDYIKGKVAWDGKSRKALVEVIPTYLSKILSAVQGSDEEYRFDYDRGKFVSYRDIKKAKDKHMMESARSAFGDLYSDTKSIIGNRDSRLTKELQKEMDEFFLAAFRKGADYWSINNKDLFDYKSGNSEEVKNHNKEVKKLRESLGLNGKNADKLIDILRAALIDENGDKVKSKYAKTIGQVEIARNKMANQMKEWSASGDNIYNALYNNSFALGRTHGEDMKFAKNMADFGKLNSQFQDAVLKYLDGIYKFTGVFADNIDNLVGGGIGRGKKRKLNKRRLTSNTNIATAIGGGSNINSTETSKEESTQEALANSTMHEDDDELTEEEINRRRNDSMNASARALSDTIFGSNWKGAPRAGLQILRAPFDAATRFFNKITDGFNEFLWGDPHGSNEGVFARLIKKADEKLDQIFTNGIGKTIKDKAVQLKNYLFGESETPGFFHKFGTNTLDSLKSVGRWFGSSVRGALYTPIKDPKYKSDNGTAAGGRRVTKSGVVTVSEGELIVPSELNPFYHGKTDKRKQIQTENEIYRNYLGSFAPGGTVGGDTAEQHIDPNHLALIHEKMGDKTPSPNQRVMIEGHPYVYINGQWVDGRGSLADRATNAAKSIYESIKNAANNVLEGIHGNQSEEDKAKSNVRKAFMKAAGKELAGEAKANNGAIGAGAAIGAVGSFLTGGLLGPIGGALVGSAAGLIIKSEKVQNLLFGKLGENGEREGGIINKEVSTFIQKHGGSIAKGGAMGTVGGLFMGSPVAGLILGSAVGFASSSEDFQDKLFGARIKDENGNYTGERIDNGMISKALQDHIKKNAPKGIAGGILGYLAGPFPSPTLNLILGASAGFAATSERFKNFMFGEEDKDGKRTGGLVQKIRERIIWNIDDIAHNMLNQVKGFGRNLTIAISDGVKNVTARIGRFLAGRIGGNRLGNVVLSALGLGANAGTGLIGGVLGKINRGMKRHLLKTGRDIYDRRLGRNLTAYERNKELRGYETEDEIINGGDTYSKIDLALSGIKDEEDLSRMRSGISDLLDPRRNMYKNQEKAISFAESKFGKYLTKGNKKALIKYIKNGGSEQDLENILNIYTRGNASDRDKYEYSMYKNQLREYIQQARNNYANAGNVNNSEGVQRVSEALKNAGLDVSKLSKYELSNMQALLGTEKKRIDEENLAKDTNDKIAKGNEILEDINKNGIQEMNSTLTEILNFIRGNKVGYADTAGSARAMAEEGGRFKGADGKWYKVRMGTKMRANGIVSSIAEYFHKRKTGETWQEHVDRLRAEGYEVEEDNNQSDEEEIVQSFNGRQAYSTMKSTVSKGELIIPIGKNAAKTVKINEANASLALQSVLHTGMQDVATAAKYVDHMARITGNFDAIGGNKSKDFEFGTNFTGDKNEVNATDKDAREKKTVFDGLANPHQFSLNGQGEWVEEVNDKETDASRRTINSLIEALKRLSGPGLAGLLGIGGLTAAAAAKNAAISEGMLGLFSGDEEGGSGAGAEANTNGTGGTTTSPHSALGAVAAAFFASKIGSKAFKVFKKLFKGTDAAADTSKVIDATEEATKAIDKTTDTTKATDAIEDAIKATDKTKDASKATDTGSDLAKAADKGADSSRAVDALNDATNATKTPNKNFWDQYTTKVDDLTDTSKATDAVGDATKAGKTSSNITDSIGDTYKWLYDSAGNYINGSKYTDGINDVITALDDPSKLADKTKDLMDYYKTNKVLNILHFDKFSNVVDKAKDLGKGAVNAGKTVIKKSIEWISKYADAIGKFCMFIAAGLAFASFLLKRNRKVHDILAEFIEPGIIETQNNNFQANFETFGEFKSYCESNPNNKAWFENHPFGAIIHINGGSFFPYHLLAKAAQKLASSNAALEAGIVPDFAASNVGTGNKTYNGTKMNGNIFEGLQYEYYDYTYIADTSGYGGHKTGEQLVKGGKFISGCPATRFVQNIQAWSVKDFTFFKSYAAYDTTNNVDKIKEKIYENVADAAGKTNKTLGDICGATLSAAVTAGEVALNLLGGFVLAGAEAVTNAIIRATNTSVSGMYEWYRFPVNFMQGTIDGFIAYNDAFWNDFTLTKPNEKLPSLVKFSYSTHEGIEESHIADIELANKQRLAKDKSSDLGKKYAGYAAAINDFYDGIISDVNGIHVVGLDGNTDFDAVRLKEQYNYKYSDDKKAALEKLYSMDEDPTTILNNIYKENQNGGSDFGYEFATGRETAMNSVRTRASILKRAIDKLSDPAAKYKPKMVMDYNFGKHYYTWEDGVTSSTVEKYDTKEAHFDQTRGVYSWPDGKITKKLQYSDNSYYDQNGYSGSGSGLARYSGKGSASTGEFISQYDPAYASKKIGSKSFADAGCGPSVAAMTASTFGLNLPIDKAIDASSRYQDNNGVEADYFSSVLGKQGIDTNYLDKSKDIMSNLQAGNPVVMLGNDPTNSNKSLSPWGPDNHYVLGRGITKDGNILVEDPEMKGPTVYSPSILNNTKLGISTEYSAGASGLFKNKKTKVKKSSRRVGRGTRDAIKEQVYSWLTSNGYSAAAAAGIMGNIEQESGFDPTNLTPEGAIAAGLFQWHDYTAYKTNPTAYSKMDRFGGLAKLAAENGRDWTDVEMQIIYMDKEFSKMNNWLDPKNSSDSGIRKAGKGGYYNSKNVWQNGTFKNAGLDYEKDGTTYEGFKKLDDPGKAAQYFEAAFERAGHPNMKRRIEAAYEYYNKFSGKTLTYDASKYPIAEAGAVTASADALQSLASTGNIDASNMSSSQKVSAIMDYFFNGVLPGSNMNMNTEYGGDSTYSASLGDYGDATNVQQALVEYAKSREDREHYSQENRERTINGVYQSDCSSFAQRAYKEVTGLNIGSNTVDQYNKAKNEDPMKVIYKSKGNRKDIVNHLQPGDLVYWYTPGHRSGASDDISHVEMYAGDGKLIGQDASGAGRMGPHVKMFDSFRASPDKFLLATRLKPEIIDKLNGKINLEKSMADGSWQKKAEVDAKNAYITKVDSTKGIYYWSDGKQTTSATRDFKAEYNTARAKEVGYTMQGSNIYHWKDGKTTYGNRDFYTEERMSGSGSGMNQMVTMEKILKKYKKPNVKVSTPKAPEVEVKEYKPITGSGSSSIKPISIDNFKHKVTKSKGKLFSGGASGNVQISASEYKAFFELVADALTGIKNNTSVNPTLASSMVAFASNTKAELNTNSKLLSTQIQSNLAQKRESEINSAIEGLSSQLAAIIDG